MRRPHLCTATALLGAFGLALTGCGEGGPSEANIARNEAVLAAVPLPPGTVRLVTRHERHAVEGRFCSDGTRWTLRTERADEEAIVTFFETELAQRGWDVHRADVGGGEPVDFHVVAFERDGADVGLDTERFAREGTYRLNAGQPC